MKARFLAPLAVAAVLSAGAAQAQNLPNLRIGLREDPDIMDPTLARSFVGRIVFASLCDKLFDINDKLEIVPQLATGHRWEDPKTLVITLRDGVTFHDGERMDAEAVRFSLMRHLTMQGSFRRGEITDLEAVEVVDPLTVRLRLKQPSAPFLSQLTDRAGMIVSPKAADAAGRDFGARPVCAGPFRFVERVAQDRIVLERFANYWNAANIHFNRVTFQPITDSTARLANLQSGTLELIEVTSPSDVPGIRRDRRLGLATVDGLGYWGIIYNIGNGARAQSPIGQDRRVREAFDLSIDREALIQVVYEGLHTPSSQPIPPASPMHVRALRVTARNVDRAKALLREAGIRTPVTVDLMVANSPELRQAAEVMQSMAAEAGFELRIVATEFASALQAGVRGDFQAYLSGWSGRPDPDGNVWTFLHSRGAQNDGKYANPEVDALLDQARAESEPARRTALYAQAFGIALTQDRARSYLWHPKTIVAHTTRLQGFSLVPDGLIRLQGVRLR
ncbi:peptide/nickel transport system substrate-binding protein [Roseomonas rosea]|uniref:Peptide/nickel transport system substrate-binding protein n=1 Tax=Muricoccus roseus TaxID=198092 RepID=A0A1M6H611_9PROT|nr:ABC transporter substrate-binding protein [Roseomonas rosea]SHJ17614.1 peptide/nickel transport system substrate-binding protein [Roseomonas rosea]